MQLFPTKIRRYYARFVAKDNSDVINECLFGNLECDGEEPLDVLSTYDVRQVPNVSNVQEVFTKLVHQETVQKPNSITERWRTILRPFSRRPIALTCGPCLEFPIGYQLFPELHEVFSSILAPSIQE